MKKVAEGQYRLTNEGLVALDRVLSYGVPFSYRPSYDLTEEFLFGDTKNIKRYDDTDKELLVYRYLNVLGSGASHATYFKKVDQIIVDMIEARITSGEIPSAEHLEVLGKPFVLAIADTGSGDGTFLAHIHAVIRKTPYGRLMDDPRGLFKLEIVGVDYNQEAQFTTSQNLNAKDIEHIVMFGNINDPFQIVNDVQTQLKNKHVHAETMVIHTRTFLDHNRPWVDVKDEAAANAIQSASTGAYGWRGRAIPNNQVEQNLREHFKAWADALKSVGQKDLIVVELHTIDPEKAVQNFGKSLDVPYSLSHAFSDQFIIEKSIYLNAVQYAGFHNDQDPSHHQYFPNKEGLSTVSINYFTVGDKAQTSIIRPNLTGGIDLNPSLGYVTIIRDSNGEPVPMNFPQIQNINMLGLQPILLKIVAFNGRVLEK